MSPFGCRRASTSSGLWVRVDVHAIRKVLVVDRRHRGQRVPPSLEGQDQAGTVEAVPLGGHRAGRALDRFVRDLSLERLRRLDEVVPGQAHEQASVLLPAVGGEARDTGVLRGEPLEARVTRAGDVQDEAFVAGEGLVAVLGDGLPEGAAGKLRPAPLLAVAVPVAHEDIEQPRLEQRAVVGPIALPRLEALVQLRVVDDLGDPAEAGVLVRDRARVLGERADGPREGLLELPQRRVVGHDHEPPGRAGDSGRVAQDPHDHLAGRVLARHLVLEHPLHDRAPQVFLEQLSGVLVDAAERVVLPVHALHGQPLRLLSAHAPDRREAAGLLPEVQHFEGDRRRPEIAVVAPPEPAMATARLVLRPRDHGPGGWCVRARDHRDRGRGPQQDRRNEPPETTHAFLQISQASGILAGAFASARHAFVLEPRDAQGPRFLKSCQRTWVRRVRLQPRSGCLPPPERDAGPERPRRAGAPGKRSRSETGWPARGQG